MTREGWKDLFEATGLLAVVGSLVFVGIETRNNATQAAINTRAIEIASYQELTNNIVSSNLMQVGDTDFLELTLKAARNPETLSEIERRRYRIWTVSRLRHADLAFFQFERGIIEEDRLKSALAPLQATFRTQIGREEWAYFRSNFVASFRSYIDEYIESVPLSDGTILGADE